MCWSEFGEPSCCVDNDIKRLQCISIVDVFPYLTIRTTNDDQDVEQHVHANRLDGVYVVSSLVTMKDLLAFLKQRNPRAEGA